MLKTDQSDKCYLCCPNHDTTLINGHFKICKTNYYPLACIHRKYNYLIEHSYLVVYKKSSDKLSKTRDKNSRRERQIRDKILIMIKHKMQ